MLPIALLLLASPPSPASTPHWALSIDLPRRVDVAGVGLFEARSRSVFLLRGPLSRALAERCSLEIDAPLATATATSFLDPDVPLVFEERGLELYVANGAALMPRGAVQLALRAGGVGVGVLRVAVEGQLRLSGRRDGERVIGDVELLHPRDVVEGPSFVRLTLPSDALVLGRFVLRPTSATRCGEIAR